MKNIIIAFSLLLTFNGLTQNWNFIGPSTGVSNASQMDLETSPNGNLFLAVLNGTQLTVKKWNGTTWANLGAAMTVHSTAQDVQLVVVGNNYPVVAYKTNLGTYPYNQYLNIYGFNGSTWNSVAVNTDYGSYNVHEYSRDYSLTVNQNDELVLTFWNSDEQANNYTPDNEYITVNIDQSQVLGGSYPDIAGGMNPSDVLSTATMGNTTHIGFSISDMGIWTDLFSSVNGGDYTNQNIDSNDDAEEIELSTKNNASALSILWKNTNGTTYLKYKSFNGSTYGTEVTISTSNVVEFDLATSFSNAYAFYRVGSTCYLRKITNIATPTVSLVSSGSTLAPGTATNLRTEYGKNTNVIAYIDGGKVYVKELNNNANIEDWDYFVMCEGTSFNNSASNSIYLLDDNNYATITTMTVTSQNTAIIPQSSVSVSGSGTSYSVFITSTNDVTAPTIVDLEFKLYDNGVLVDTKLIPITVNPKPTITFNNATSSICKNASPVNLLPMASPVGGTWSGSGVTGNMFYPNNVTGSIANLTYTKTNVYGCTASDVASIAILNPPTLTVNMTPADCNQNNGTAEVTISGGQAPYTTYWSSGSTSNQVTDLATGAYYVNVTDANGCMSVHPVMIPSSSFTLSGLASDVACFNGTDGSIDLNLTGGTPPFTYNWSNGAITQDIASLSAGPYEVTVTDGSGCVSTASYTINSPTQMELTSSTATQPNCNLTNGSVSLSINGGTSPYTYAWTDISGNNIGSAMPLTGIGGGVYNCAVTDAKGCVANFTQSLSTLNGPVIAVDTVINATCAADGQIQTSVVSGTPLSYLWSNGETTASITNLAAGTYSCEVTGASGCIFTLSATVSTVLPESSEICLVTVDTITNTNLVVWEKPITTGIDHFNIYRETSQAGLYQLAGSVNYSDESVFNDTVASPNVRSWRYKISSVDVCGVESQLSDNHKTIHLIINQGLGSDINLSWDSYEGFAYPNFKLWRRNNLTGWTMIQTMPTNLFTYTDANPSTDGLAYVVTVDAPSTCSSTKKAQDFNTCRSNKDNRFSTGQPNSISELLLETVSIYPNPTVDVLNIHNTSSQSIIGLVMDQTGRVIEELVILPGQSKMNCKELAAGLYTLELQFEQTKAQKRFVINK